MPTVEVKEWVSAPAEQVYEKLTRMEEFPSIMANVESVVVQERGPDYTVTEWVAKLQGTRFHWIERDQFFADTRTITFHQVEGDLKVFQGAWAVTTEGARSLVTFTTEFEFGIPMLAGLLNPVARYALRQNGLSMLRGIQASLTAPSP
jgi:coenzyme Q-binding protein COQ10